ncbi:MAG TPA: MBL fold metallo-hydrolase [Gemmatimonadales bacterium]|nr:MBL fold metallo-hydrolase [Gemmatimonadales bacterium]
MPGRAGGLLRWLLVERLLHPPPRDPDPSSFAVATPAVPAPRAEPGELVVTWVGHATFLVQIGGRNILTDPMWGERASPARFAGPRRWVRPGMAFSDLPPIDAVVQSHNHYDHLDDGTVRRLARSQPQARWLAPLGLAPFLRSRGVRGVAELDWWEEHHDDGVTYTCAPAQHFSARGPWDRNRTLWCSWGIAAGGRRLYFGGDSGLHPEYGSIGERCGPFDVTLLPIGAYEPRWFMRPVHMNPEEAVEAYRALARSGNHATPTFVAMHWGTFKLTDEPMDEPPRRLRAAWVAAGLPPDRLWIPAHGETRHL